MRLAGLAFLSLAVSAGSAAAIPSFARETQQPCSACHVGAFGPQLKQTARDFKLFGYTNGIGKQDLKSITLMMQASYTHTRADQSPPPVDGFGANDNVALDELNAFFGGKLFAGAGAFAEVSYDGVEHKVGLGDLDIRRAHDFDLGSHDLVAGLDLNNSPGVQDLWNTTPVWHFPFNASPFGPAPTAAALIDGGLEGKTLGLGGYGMLDDTLYLEASAYNQPGRHELRFVGIDVDPHEDRLKGVAPYWRVALQHNFHDQHYLQVGAFGLAASMYPSGDRSAGTDRYRDIGVDATYQFTASKTHYISAHGAFVDERSRHDAGSVLFGFNPENRLRTTRWDVSYSYKDRWTPTVQLFRTWGTADPARFANGSPNSSGMIAELAFTPFGKVDSAQNWWNARMAVQYVAYTRFDGQTRNASANNTLFVSLWLAMAPF